MNQVLSIIIPAHNEEKTIYQLLTKISELSLPNDIQKEIIVINDFSTDSTDDEIKKFLKNHADVKYLSNEKNLGKSRTVKKGLLLSKGDYIIIQDADLEYDPADIILLIKKLIEDKLDFIYGNRFGKKNDKGYNAYYLGNKGISFMSNIFTYLKTGQTIPDMEVCYKLIKGEIARDIARQLVSTSSFGLEPEITARLIKYRKVGGEKLKFTTIPISYFPRTMEQGKHIRFSDGIKAFIEIIRFNM